MSSIPISKPPARPLRDSAKWYPHDYLLAAIFLPLLPARIRPNHITVVRFILIPFVLWFLATEQYGIGIALFLLAAFSDALDGSLARVRNQITPWGSFYDPLADKLLIGSVVLLVVMRFVGVWFALLIVCVELMIAVGAYFWRRSGRITTANIYGKAKMFLQVTGVCLLLIGIAASAPGFVSAAVVVLSAAIAFAIVSLITYGI